MRPLSRSPTLRGWPRVVGALVVTRSDFSASETYAAGRAARRVALVPGRLRRAASPY
jgi:hypothetical protein